MIQVTRDNLQVALTEEDSFSLKIIADRYLLKDTEKTPEYDSVVVAEFIQETTSQAGYNTIKEVALVDSYDKTTEMVTVTVFTGVDRGKQFEVKRNMVDVLLEKGVEDLQKRLAKALGGNDPALEEQIQKRAMSKILFGGRILAGAGTGKELTYFNCYVAPRIHDSRGGIADHRKTVMEIMSRGGGVGSNISTLRPAKSKVHKVIGRSSGSVSWAHDISELTNLVQQGGSRRGAQMIIMDDFHPDLLEFITSKVQKPLQADVTIDGVKRTLKFGKRGNMTLTGANISVGLSEKFMKALYAGEDWQLVYPDVANYTAEQMEVYDEHWSKIGDPWKFQEITGLPLKVHATIPASDIENLISVCMTGSAEPGIIFMERYNQYSNSWYYNPIIATNPCGEQGLPEWGVCNLGHANLAEHVKFNPATGRFEMDWNELEKTIRTLVRALDNVIDATPYYFEANRENQQNERRLGLGTLGADEALKLMGYDYGEQDGLDMAEDIFEFITVTAYEESIELAKEKGAFEYFSCEEYLQSEFMKFLCSRHPHIKESIQAYGIRNVTIITQAPTGTTGTLAQTSTGIEPFFAGEFWRSSRIGVTVQKAPVIKRAEAHGIDTSKFKYAGDYTTKQHLDFQAVCQRWCDSSISKTINAPKETTVADVAGLIRYSHEIGLKGFTVYVDGSREFQVLGTDETATETAQELPMDSYKVKNPFAKGEVKVAYEDGKPKKIVIDLESFTDKEITHESVLGALVKQALEAHNSTDCPECSAPLVFEEGCYKCQACSFSKCG